MKIITNIGMHEGLTFIEGCPDSGIEFDEGMQEGTSGALIMSRQNFPVPIVRLKEEIEEK